MFVQVPNKRIRSSILKLSEISQLHISLSAIRNRLAKDTHTCIILYITYAYRLRVFQKSRYTIITPHTYAQDNAISNKVRTPKNLKTARDKRVFHIEPPRREKPTEHTCAGAYYLCN